MAQRVQRLPYELPRIHQRLNALDEGVVTVSEWPPEWLIRRDSYAWAVKVRPGLSRGEIDDLASLGAPLHFIADAKPWADSGRAMMGWLQQRVPCTVNVIRNVADAATVDTAEKLSAAMDGHGVTPDHVVVAFGGSSVCNVTGFLAAVRNPAAWVRIGTTQRAQLGVCLGTHSTISTASRADAWQVYQPPTFALLDPLFWGTRRRKGSGLVTLLQAALCRDASLVDLLEEVGDQIGGAKFNPEAAERVLTRTVAAMLPQAYADATATRLDSVTRFGCTLGPLISRSRSLSMEDGAAIDMALLIVIATRRGTLAEDKARRFLLLIRRLGLPIWIDGIGAKLLDRAVGELKTTMGRPPILLPTGGEQPPTYTDKITTDELVSASEVLQDSMWLRQPRPMRRNGGPQR